MNTNDPRYTEKRAAGARNEVKAGNIRRQYIQDYKMGKPCMDCEQSYPSVCMDFDHRDQATKRMQINELCAKRMSWKVINDELAKCDLVCSNCHRIRTDKQRKAVGHRTWTIPIKNRKETYLTSIDVIM